MSVQSSTTKLRSVPHLHLYPDLPEVLSLRAHLHSHSTRCFLRSVSTAARLLFPLLTITLAVHAIRIYAIYDRSSAVGIGMGALYAIQVVVTAVCCGFYRSVPLDVGQGCIAGPKGNWVGIYWLLPTLLYTASVSHR